MPKLVHQRLHLYLDIKAFHRLMETNAHMMEACVVHVKAMTLNQKPPSHVELALGYLRRRPRLGCLTVELDMMAVLAEAMRRGYCDAVEVLKLCKGLGDSNRDWSAERWSGLQALCKALGDGLYPRLNTLIIDDIWTRSDDFEKTMENQERQMIMLGEALRSRKESAQPCCPLRSVTLKGKEVYSSPETLLSLLPYESLEELHLPLLDTLVWWDGPSQIGVGWPIYPLPSCRELEGQVIRCQACSRRCRTPVWPQGCR